MATPKETKSNKAETIAQGRIQRTVEFSFVLQVRRLGPALWLFGGESSSDLATDVSEHSLTRRALQSGFVLLLTLLFRPAAA